jgi:hypothetical protein
MHSSGRAMCVLLSMPIPVGGAVRVDVDGTLLLGEVCHCHSEDQNFAVELELDQALTVSEELSRLMRGLQDASFNSLPIR